MKIQYKTGLLFFLFSISFLAIGIISYDFFADQSIIERAAFSQLNITNELALHIESHLEEKSANAMALANTPLLRRSLQESNEKYSVLSDEERTSQIDLLNNKWMNTDSIQDPFINSYMNNTVANHLLSHQQLFPEEFGEIFLTNRYGVIIGTTKKLTTLAHSQKYWWITSYNEGKGRIFIDDRGFDTSVGGYVIGVVIPIIEENEIIGILKCNINILGPISHLIENYNKAKNGVLKLIRTGGLIVIAEGKEPLSVHVDQNISQELLKKENGSRMIELDGKMNLVTFATVQLTQGSEKYGFGGKKESIDQLKGNLGEAWHTVISREESDILEASHDFISYFIQLSIVISVAMVLLALVIGKLFSIPIIRISETAKEIGQGNLDIEITSKSKDEIGNLATTFNQMTKNLKKITASRDELNREINERKRAEKKLQRSEANLSRAQKVGKMGSWFIDLGNNNIEWSDEVYRIFNMQQETNITFEKLLTFIHPDDRNFMSDAWQAALEHAPYDIEHRIMVNGVEKWVREIAEIEFDVNGKALHGIGTIQDITDIKKTEKELQEANKKLTDMAMQDGLTQIANRRNFDTKLIEEWHRMMREKKPLSLIIFDVDHFKLYNDTYGHQAGDLCLQTLAKIASQLITRSGDHLARYGGEEFTIILPNTTIESAKTIAETLRNNIHEAKINHDSSPVCDFVTISCGISSVMPNEESSYQVVLEVADKALYEAKEQGRNRVVIKPLN